MYGKCMANQGWEFTHWFSEGIARFLPKNERMSDLLKNIQFTDSLIFGERPVRFTHNHSFPLSDLSETLMIDHFGEHPERFARIAHFG